MKACKVKSECDFATGDIKVVNNLIPLRINQINKSARGGFIIV
jgi:hypothetical protein